MSQTIVSHNDPKTQKKWSADLAVDARKKSYFEAKFIGTSENSIIQRKTELDTGSGDRISFDLSVQMRGEATYGDARLEGKEESLKFYTDEVNIDQVRKAASSGGRMTRKRTVHDLRTVAKGRLSDWFARFYDEAIFMYLSGARGINADFIETPAYTGFARNPFETPDDGHILFGGDAISKQTLTSADIMTRSVIERACTKATMMQAEDPETANMVPVKINSEEHYVCVMSPYQEFDLRNNDAGGWLEIQKAAAAAEGKSNPIFKGGLGMINNTVLHSHRNVIRFDDYGASADLAASRALFMGRQAAVVAYGNSGGGLRYQWEEETKDYGNELTVASGFIGGMKKTRFNDRDFGVLSIDTYATDPNPATV